MPEKQLSNRQRAQQAFDTEIRVLEIVDMASMTATEAFHDRSLDGALEDFVDHLMDEGSWKHPSTAELSAIMQRRPDDQDMDEDDDPEPEHYVRGENSDCAARAGLLGLGIKFGSPVREYTDRGSYYSGFGYMRTVWIYAETFEEAWRLGVEWADAKHEEDLTKAKAA